MTHPQLQIIHQVKRQLGYDDAEYRMVLRNFGQVESSKDLDNYGFERVMAFFESVGAKLTNSPGYWAAKVARQRNMLISERQVRHIEAMAADYAKARGWDSTDFLGGFIHRMTQGRTARIDHLKQYEAHNLTEALKKMQERIAETVGSEELVVGNTGVSPEPLSPKS
jgi:hypothetical protein